MTAANTTDDAQKQLPWHESIVQQLGLLTSDFDKSRPEAAGDNSWHLRLEAKVETLAELIRWTKTPKDVDKVLAAWTGMKKMTGLDNDYDITDLLNKQLEGLAAVTT